MPYAIGTIHARAVGRLKTAKVCPLIVGCRLQLAAGLINASDSNGHQRFSPENIDLLNAAFVV